MKQKSRLLEVNFKRDKYYGTIIDGVKYISNGEWLVQQGYCKLPAEAELAFSMGKEWESNFGFRVLRDGEECVIKHAAKTLLHKAEGEGNKLATKYFTIKDENSTTDLSLFLTHDNRVAAFKSAYIEALHGLRLSGVDPKSQFGVWHDGGMVGVIMPMKVCHNLLSDIEKIANAIKATDQK